MRKGFDNPAAPLRALFHHAARLVLPLALALHAAPAPAQCVLQPGASGQNGQTLSQNFFTLVDDLYAFDFHPTHSMTIGGKTLQVPPWFKYSDKCDATTLKDGSDAGLNPPLASPSFADYLVVSDELSELAVVTALAESDARMMAIHNTIQAMASATHPGLPCWLAEMSGSALTCRSQDTATDATARFGLAYYHAAYNPAFPAASRAIYRAAGDALAANHLTAEYDQGRNHCYTSSVTQQQVCDWVGGGANTVVGGVGNLKMWIGYSQDVARFLLAAYVSTGNSAYLTRAGEVVDQWLIASSFDGTHLTFGRTNFTWNTTAQPIAPQPGDSYYWQQGRAWDDSDAPRALWMGDVLRAFDLASGHAPMTGAYAVYGDLSAWVQLVLGSGNHQTATTSCIQYNQDGTVVSGNCGTDFYFNGLGAGLSTYDGTSLLATKLSTALSQFGWNASPPTWNRQACFGIYRGIRPLKALAAAIGLDAATWGGTPCGGASATLTVTAAGTGSGTVTSSPAGISCPGSCAAAFAAGTAVTLSAAAAAGSSFGGWSGACGGTGGCAFTLNSDQAVTATFTASGTPPASPTWLRVTTVSASELKLTWQDNSNNESGFKVERKQGCCGPWTPLPDAPANSTGTATYESTGLGCGTTYAYHVWAFNAAGASAQTNEAAAATSACP